MGCVIFGPATALEIGECHTPATIVPEKLCMHGQEVDSNRIQSNNLELGMNVTWSLY